MPFPFRRLISLGAQDGAWVDIRRVRSPMVCVRGLGGNPLKIHTRTHEGELKLYLIEVEGEHVIEPAAWIRVEGAVRTPGLVCEVASMQAA